MSKLECLELVKEIFLDVPHGTEEKLSHYVELLLKWNEKINLISKNTIQDIWMRHIADSIQLAKYINRKKDTILDIGTGAGLPGIILSILGVKKVLLLDSDQRKCVFLLEAARILNLECEVINDRLENIDIAKVEVITCRGFADMNKTFEQTIKIKYDKMLLFKGKNYKNEVEEAQLHWEFTYRAYPSVTEFESYILDITDVYKK